MPAPLRKADMDKPSTTKSAPIQLYCDPAIGDLIIQASDGVEFHVHKDVMAKQSDFFAAMFSLPQPALAPPDAGRKQVVVVQEPSAVWTIIIPSCYGAGRPALTDIARIRSVLDAGRKYEMASVIEAVRHALLQPEVVEEKPLNVYALGFWFELEDVARTAAFYSLRFPVYFDYVDELDLLSLRAYHRLLEYRRKCVAVALEVTSPGPIRERLWSTYFLKDKLGTCNDLRNCPALDDGSWGYSIRATWVIYFNKLERQLELTPDAILARSPVLLSPVIQSTNSCPGSCARKIHAVVAEVSTALEKKLREAISEVEFEL